MIIYGVLTGYNEERKPAYFTKTKEVAERIAYIHNYSNIIDYNINYAEVKEIELLDDKKEYTSLAKFLYIEGYVMDNNIIDGEKDTIHYPKAIYTRTDLVDEKSKISPDDKDYIKFEDIKSYIEPAFNRSYDSCNFFRIYTYYRWRKARRFQKKSR